MIFLNTWKCIARSCLTILLECFEEVTSRLDQGEPLDVIYLDFKKAFAKVFCTEADEGTEGILAKFADNTKIGRGTGSIEATEKLQKDLDRLGDWAKKWQMELNMGKCKVMHIGKNTGMDYFLNGGKIQKSQVQRDLGVLVEDPVK
eukprot:g24986.t1